MGSIDDLRATEQELISAIRDLAEKERQSAIKQEAYNQLHGVGPNGPMPQFAGLTPAQAGAAQGQAQTPFWQSEAAGTGVSAVQKFLSSGGGGSLAGAIASPAGLATAAIGFGVNAIGSELQRQEDIKQAGRNALENAPLNESTAATRFREEQATKLAKIDAEENDFFANSRILFNQKERDEIKRANVEERRIINRETERFSQVEGSVERQTEAFFAPLARGGGHATREQIRDIANFYKKQADAQYAMHQDIEEIASQITVTKPGSAGQQGKR